MSEEAQIRGRNVTLIGMPGSGKSTIGRLLAARRGWSFLDMDERIEALAGRKLWEVVADEGFEGLARREEEENATLRVDRCVIAPGGSVIYFEPAMRNLRSLGPMLYLSVPADLLEKRAGDLRVRATFIRPEMSFAALAAERDPLYRAWADGVVECGQEPADRLMERVEAALQGFKAIQAG